MSTYYIKTTGSNTWPFDTEEKSANTLNDLFIALGAHGVSLSNYDIVNVRGIITEPLVNQTWDFNEAVLRGGDSKVDEVFLCNNTISYAIIRHLEVWTDNSSSSCVILNPFEISYSRIGFKSPYIDALFIRLIQWVDDIPVNTHVYNNIFYAIRPEGGAFVETDWYLSGGIVNSVIFENNTYVSLDAVYVAAINSSSVGRLIIRNEIDTITNGSNHHLNYDDTTIIGEFQHLNNSFFNEPDYSWYNSHTHDSENFSRDITEIIADPLFVGSGDEPYRLQEGSPCKGTGYRFFDSPSYDILGNIHSNPPNMGAFDDNNAPSPILNGIKNGIVFATSEIRNMTKCYDMVFIATDIKVDSIIIAKGCSFYGHVY